MKLLLVVVGLLLNVTVAATGKVNYGIPSRDDVKAVMDKVLHYIERNTPAELVDEKNGRTLSEYKDINEYTRLKKGAFKLVCYEWGVTYSAALRAAQVTNDQAYSSYALSRLRFLSEIAPYFQALRKKRKPVDRMNDGTFVRPSFTG